MIDSARGTSMAARSRRRHAATPNESFAPPHPPRPTAPRQGASREVVVAAHHRSGPVGAVQVLDDLVHGRVALLEAVVGLDHGGLANRHAALGNFHREAVKAALRARVVAGAPADESKALVA